MTELHEVQSFYGCDAGELVDVDARFKINQVIL